MPPHKEYYIRKNHAGGNPSSVLFLDCETRGEQDGDVEWHTAHMAVTWHTTLDGCGDVSRSTWNDWTDNQQLAEYVTGLARPRLPLLVVGSNITFDLIATGLLGYLHLNNWTCETLYEKGTTTILSVLLNKRRIRFVALQNWMQGGVKQWGDLLGLPKLAADYNASTAELWEYCRRDVEITGKTFLNYVRFVHEHNLGHLRLTTPSQALGGYRHRFLKPKSILHYDRPDYNEFTWAAYYGGRVEARQIGENLTGRFIQLDVNSMYPAVMTEHHYPGVFKQWIAAPSIEAVSKALKSYCLLAEVEIDTDEPAYPVRYDNKLIFPTGTFNGFLSSASLAYAIKHNHIRKILQVMKFTKADLFSTYVEEFYTLKQRYKKEGNAVYEATAKLLLNSLYGKFGEKRDRELVKSETDRTDLYRRPVLFDPDTLSLGANQNGAALADHNPTKRKLIWGTEWACLGTYCLTAGTIEGPMSSVPICAHVTDHARMLLWSYIKAVGWKNVLYCDTDSLIIEEQHLPKLKTVINDETLGRLKIEGRAENLSIRGPKDYTFGNKLRRKGIRPNAELVKPQVYSQDQFAGLYTCIRNGRLDAFPISKITKTLTQTYTKGVVTEPGYVEPLHMIDNQIVNAPTTEGVDEL